MNIFFIQMDPLCIIRSEECCDGKGSFEVKNSEISGEGLFAQTNIFTGEYYSFISHLMEKVNDFMILDRQKPISEAIAEYNIRSKTRENMILEYTIENHKIIMMRMRITKNIRPGEEVFRSYGAHHWLRRELFSDNIDSTRKSAIIEYIYKMCREDPQIAADTLINETAEGKMLPFDIKL